MHVWGTTSHGWKLELVFVVGRGKKGFTASDYLKQVLKPVVGLAFHDQKAYKTFHNS